MEISTAPAHSPAHSVSIDRRHALAGLLATVAGVAGCSSAADSESDEPDLIDVIPSTAATPSAPDSTAPTTTGSADAQDDPRPIRSERGVDSWIDEQLTPLSLDTRELDEHLAATFPEVDDPSAVIESRAQTLAAVARLEHFVDQMLQLARIDGADDASGARRLIDLDELVLAQAGPLRRTTNLEIDTAEVSGGQLRGRENELGRVIENLTANAVRHARATIRLTVSEGDGIVRLTVDDDGPGVPPGERRRVFTRFARLDDSRVRGGGGTGLGLAIVESIVTEHGGSIRVEESTLGGASFVVVIPHSLSVVGPAATTGV